jgi:arylsulfatase A-like enzyme
VPAILPAAARGAGRPPNVILYVVDTLRTDRMSLYGYGRPTTPELRRLARGAYVFDQADAAGSFTMPSVTALLASRRASELRGKLDPAGPAQRTLAEVFHAAGYDTAGFQANLLVTKAGGFARGFHTYELVGRVTKDGLGKASAGELHDRALDWVRAHRERPFFLYLQSMDVHFPYAPPGPFRDMFAQPATAPAAVPPQVAPAVDAEAARAFAERLAMLSPDRYDGAVAYADMELGRLFAALQTMGLADDTIIVLTADHGEPLGDRHEIFHGRALWNELVRVPLVMWVPGRAGGRVEEVVSLMDVAPTLSDLAGLGIPSSFVGRSWLAPASSVRPPGATGELVKGTNFATIGWYAREGPWKVIVDPEKGAQLFHIPSDPRETRDVSAAHPELTRYLVGRATAMPPLPQGTGLATGTPQTGLGEEDRRRRNEALRALGYVEGE